MSERGLYCVARVVLYNKEQLVSVRALDEVLCMTTLRYAHQVKSAAAFADERAEASISEAEYALAGTLIDETTLEEFDLSLYQDQYTERLTRLIESKVSGAEIVEAPLSEAPSVINLMEALKASVSKAQEAKSAGSPLAQKSDRTKKTPAKKSAKKAASPLAKSLANPGKGKTKRAASRKKQTG
jgi:DNA end-binding protein Ku